MTSTHPRPFEMKELSGETDRLDQLARDAREGLTRTPKSLPCKYLYDARGSAFFEEITKQPEYYPTRSEIEILENHADSIMAAARPAELLEIGSGSSRKTRVLLEAMHRTGGNRYVPLDVSRDALEAAGKALTDDYPWLEVRGLVGDFAEHLDEIPRNGRRLVAFLGSTIGNLEEHERAALLRVIRQMLEPGDTFLLGVDLVKDARVLEAAYNDEAGVTARFTKNILHVLNRELGGNLPVDEFDHVARWDPERSRVDIRLRSRREIDARLDEADLGVHFDEGEDVHIEISCKFRRDGVREALDAASLELKEWYTDSEARFGAALAAPV